MKIRTRAFAALWLVGILVAATIGFVLFALNVAAPQMDAERQRISEVLQVHGSLWRVLVELKHDQHDFIATNLPSIRERVQRGRSSVNDYLPREISLVRIPEQKTRLEELRKAIDSWYADFATSSATSQARSSPFRTSRKCARSIG